MAKKESKFSKVIGEFGKGKLHSGSKKGPKVKNPKQAVAIAYSEQDRSNRQKKRKANFEETRKKLYNL